MPVDMVTNVGLSAMHLVAAAAIVGVFTSTVRARYSASGRSGSSAGDSREIPFPLMHAPQRSVV